MNILQTPTPRNPLNPEILRPKYPEGGGGWVHHEKNLLHHHQHISGPNRVPDNHANPNHPSRLGRLQFVLHLHRLNHHDTLPLFHILPSLHQQTHHPTRHGSLHRPRPLRPRTRTAPTLQRPRILHLKTISPSINHHPITIENTPVLPPLR